jgi:hypothetical protein
VKQSTVSQTNIIINCKRIVLYRFLLRTAVSPGTGALSWDMDSEYIYFGDSEGTILHVYSTSSLLDTDSDTGVLAPLKSFPAFSNGGVSSVCAADEGFLGRGTPCPCWPAARKATFGNEN